jgi:hypothetical protein
MVHDYQFSEGNMKFECRFAHEDLDRHHEEVVIAVELTADECRAVRAMVRDGDVHAPIKAAGMALRHAYRKAPPDYVHIANGTQQVWEH